jgi:hypothetical protein
MTKKELKERLNYLVDTESSLDKDLHFVHGQMALIQELLGVGGANPLTPPNLEQPREVLGGTPE